MKNWRVFTSNEFTSKTWWWILDRVDHFCVELQEVHLFFFIQRLRGAVGRELLSYTEGPWFVSHGGDIIFRRFLLPIQLVITARVTRLPSAVT